jgi:hypothetical protein
MGAGDEADKKTNGGTIQRRENLEPWRRRRRRTKGNQPGMENVGLLGIMDL